MQPRGRDIIYKVEKEEGLLQEYVCKDCGSKIQGAKVIQPIWDGPFPCSGSGRVTSEIVPYCPKCEPKLSSRGSPIQL